MDEPLQDESTSFLMKLGQSKNPAHEVEEPASFEDLFHEYWTPIFRLLRRLVVNPAEAEDLALETFLRLYKHHPDPAEDFNTRGWLQKVATNLGLQSIRSFKRREKYELTAGKYALEQAAEEEPSEIVVAQEEERLAREVLAGMDARQAQLLVLRHSGMAYKEIAEALGLSPTSIGPLLLRAENEFEKRYRAITEEKR